jgi:predicted alpha/beta hydrolase family esterase
VGHRVVIEATKFFGASHPSMKFITTIVSEYDRKWSTPEIKQWMKQLKRVVSEALNSF